MNNTNSLFFSVIIPLYNKQEFIERAINSVLAQSFQNFEIIIVNDGSTDNSLQRVEAIHHSKIKIVSQKNSGVSAARNRGAENSQYPYLAFLDGDDIWDNAFLETIKDLIIKFPNAGIYSSNNLFVYPDGKIIKNEVGDLFLGQKSGVIEDYFKVFSDLQRSPFSNSNLCIPKKIYDLIGGYKTGVKLTEDSDLWCRIALEYDVVYTTEPLATYFLAQDGSTHSIFENKPFEVTTMLQKKLENNKIQEKYKHSVEKLIALQKLGLIKRAILTGNKFKIFKNLFDFTIFKNYPNEYLKCIFTYFLPNIILRKILSTKSKT